MRRSDRITSVVTAVSIAISFALAGAAPATGRAAAPVSGAMGGLSAAQALDRLKALAGTWEGNIEGQEGGHATLVYRVISGGSAVLETLFPGTDHEMVSIYTVEGNELRMVHYCALGNQPRFRLDRAASSGDTLAFVLDGGSGFDPKTDAHIHAGTLRMRGADEMEAAWEYYRGGKTQGRHAMILARTAAAPAAKERL
ncbi:MAG TPA: hypothetical protein VJV75_01090 [Candidatus Polarisedimenticolia bacterium]|nr:hypothetical protein [Candidatus Polarisedimenticolia bacterium]